MQSCQIMSQSCVFALNPSHVSFANNLIFWIDKHFIDTVAIGNPEITLPNFNRCPQGLKGLMVTEPVEVLLLSPNTQANFKMIDRGQWAMSNCSP